MKNLQNPTTYFFEQANAPSNEYKDKIDDFVKKLINLDTCILCKEDFNFTDKLPRILVHCGHTLCTNCLLNFYKNGKIRCPLCLKLIKNIEYIDRIPVNHTIFTKMAQQLNEINKQNGQEEVDIPGALYAQFEASLQPKPQQQQQQYYNNGQQQQDGQDIDNILQGQKGARIDEETGLEWCEYHMDRVKHFFCMSCQVTSCRICTEVLHSKNTCSVVDLYELEDMHGFIKNFTQIKDDSQSQQQQQQQQDNGDIANNKDNHVENQQQCGSDVEGDDDDDEDSDEDEEQILQHNEDIQNVDSDSDEDEEEVEDDDEDFDDDEDVEIKNDNANKQQSEQQNEKEQFKGLKKGFLL